MDNLKKYKDVWQNQQIDNPLDVNALNKLIHKRSSSIVKWIFYISLIEFGVIIFLNIFMKTDWDFYKSYGLYHFILGTSIVGYAITVVFIVLFYMNYKSISVTNSTKDLINSIIKTRKTVKYYILLNLVFIALALLYSFYIILKTEEYEVMMDNLGKNGHFIVWMVVIFAVLFVIGVFYIFYSLLYGILVKRLNQNYKELTEETL